MVVRFTLLQQVSPVSWKGIYRGTEVILNLLPDGIILPTLECSDLKMRVPEQRIEAVINNNSYLDPDKNNVLVFGPSRLGNTVVGFGLPPDCPENSLLMIAVRGNEAMEDLEGEMAYLQEASIPDFINRHETEYLASFCDELKKYESNCKEIENV